MNVFQRFVVSAMVCLGSTAALGADTVAFISDLKGQVAVDGAPRPALLAEVAKGQRLSVGRDSHVAVMYIASGKEFMLKGPGEYLVKEAEIAAESGAAPATRATGWRPASDLRVHVAQSNSASVRMRSIAPQRPEALTAFPAQGSVATLQPTFRWRGEAKARGEFILIVAGEEKPVHIAKTLGDSYRLPVKLAPAQDYAWNVAVAGNEVAAGKFRTLAADALARIERSRPAPTAGFSDRLMFALMLQEMGAAQEAREAWAALSRERSDLPELAAFAQ
jgi:hypothetical protein